MEEQEEEEETEEDSESIYSWSLSDDDVMYVCVSACRIFR